MTETINLLAGHWWGWMAAMLWQASLLVVVVSVIDLLIGKWAWPQVRYVLWLAVLLKLLLPPFWASPISPVSHAAPWAQTQIIRVLDGEPPAATKKDAVETEPVEKKIITEEDYKITTTIGKLGLDLISISGRIGKGPRCSDLSVVATATNENGLTATIKDQVRMSSSFGSVTFRGTAKAIGSAEDRGFWKLDSVTVRCNDAEQ